MTLPFPLLREKGNRSSDISEMPGRNNLFLRRAIAASRLTSSLIGLTRQGNPKMSLRDEMLLYQDVLGVNVTPPPTQSIHSKPLLLSREFL